MYTGHLNRQSSCLWGGSVKMLSTVAAETAARDSPWRMDEWAQGRPG